MFIEECPACRYELELLLRPYDNSPCRIILTAGAGGTEACDWVDMLQQERKNISKLNHQLA
jgi:hypothetical protein